MQTPAAPSPDKRAFLHKKSAAILLGLAGLALVWLVLAWPRDPGMTAVVTFEEGQESQSMTLSLHKDQTVTFSAGGYDVHLEVQDGAIRFTQSQCPDHRCESFGWLKNEGEWALCAPAGVMVRVQPAS